MQAMLDSVASGANHEDIEGVEVVVCPALSATAVDVLEATATRSERRRTSVTWQPSCPQATEEFASSYSAPTAWAFNHVSLGRMSRLLVVHHSPTRSMQTLLDAVLAGAGDDAIEGVEVVPRPALEATAEDVLAADGYLLGSTANFGYMSGALKHFFDSTFLQIGGSLSSTGAAADASGATAGRPFGLYVHGRYDTTGAVRSVLSIVQALGWKQGYDVLDVLGDVDDSDIDAAYNLGGTLAALLAVNA